MCTQRQSVNPRLGVDWLGAMGAAVCCEALGRGADGFVGLGGVES